MAGRWITAGLRLLQAVAAAGLFLSAAVLTGRPGNAFTRNHTDNPTPGSGPALAWNAANLPIKLRFNSTAPTGIAGSQAWYAALKRALRHWIDLPTSDLTACFSGTTTAVSWAGGDGNVVYPLNTGWDGGLGVLALTNVNFILATGELTDTDMKFNGENFTWTDSYSAERAAVGGDTAFDLESVATHEFGHSLGFGHSLDNTGVSVGDPDYDDNGTPGNLTDDQINGANQNTMDPVTIAGETYQRSIATDDSAAMDAAYPAAGTVLSTPAALLVEPDDVGDNPAGGTYDIQFLSQYDGPSTPTVSLFYTANPAYSAVSTLAGATLIAGGISANKTGALNTYTWAFNLVPAGSYYIIAVISADGKTSYDLSPGRVTVGAAGLTLTAPSAPGITLTPLTDYTATWTQAGSAAGKLKIELSRDNGATFPLLIADTVDPTALSYTFTVPDPQGAFLTPGPLTQCKIRISYTGNPAIQSQSANPFTLAADSNSLTLTAPNGGETFTAGATVNLTFNATGADVGDNFQLFWTDDLGATWVPITPGINIPGPNPRTFVWQVPAQPGPYNKIQVFSLNSTRYHDLSDSPFTIASAFTRTFASYPSQLVFDVVVGGGNPANKPVYVRNAGVSLLSNCTVTVTGDANVTANPATGITVGGAPDLATINVAVNNVYGAPGTVNSNLVFTTAAANATNEGFSVPVTVRVHAAGSTAPLTFNPTALTFLGDPGAVPGGSKSLTVVNPNANVDTEVDAYPDNLNVIFKPGRFSLAAGDSTPGGADEQVLTVIGDTSGMLGGSTLTAHIVTNATNIGTANVTVTLQTTGTAPGSKKKSGCDIAPAPGAWPAWLGLLAAGLWRLLLRRRREISA